MYKIISKTLANRLKSILDNVISNSQSTFIPNRLISDNIILGHECMNFIDNRTIGNSGYAAIKLDMNKAFDRV